MLKKRKKGSTLKKAAAIGVIGAAAGATALAMSNKKNRDAAKKTLTSASKKGKSIISKAKTKIKNVKKQAPAKASKVKSKAVKKTTKKVK